MEYEIENQRLIKTYKGLMLKVKEYGIEGNLPCSNRKDLSRTAEPSIGFG